MTSADFQYCHLSRTACLCSGDWLQLLPSAPALWFTWGHIWFKQRVCLAQFQPPAKPYPLQIKKWVNTYNISPHTLSEHLTLFHWAGFLNLMCFTCLMILCKSLFQLLSFSLSSNFCIHNILWQGNPWVHWLLYRESPSSGSFEPVSQAVNLRDVYPCPGWNTECLALIHLLHIQDFVVLQST